MLEHADTCRAEPRRRGVVDMFHLEVVVLLDRVDLDDELAVVSAGLPVHARKFRVAQEPVGGEGEAGGERAHGKHEARDGESGEGEEDAGRALEAMRGTAWGIRGLLGVDGRQVDLSRGH